MKVTQPPKIYVYVDASSGLLNQIEESCGLGTTVIHHHNTRENTEKPLCDYWLYVPSPGMTGFEYIVKVVDDSNKNPQKTIFLFVEKEGEKAFTAHQIKSLKAIGEMVSRNGGTWLKGEEGEKGLSNVLGRVFG